MSPTATIDRQAIHLTHGNVPWCLRCIEKQTQAGTTPKASKELGFKGRGMTSR